MILGYLFSPIAFILGIHSNDVFTVASLLGKKMVMNEFIAYTDLSSMIKEGARTISMRAEVISTYALCGFANFSSIAIQLGGISPLATSRRGDLAKTGLKAMIAGTLVSLLNAAIAGILI